MKKINLLFVLLLFSAVTISAQVKPEFSKRVPDFIKLDKTKPGNAYFTIDRVLLTGYEDKTSQDWANNAWINVERTIEQYDTDAGTFESLMREWDLQNGVWINSLKLIASFAVNTTDSTFRFLNIEMHSWVDTAWVLFSTTVYTYDSNNFLIEINSSINLGGGLIPYLKATYTNNSAGYPLTEITQTINFSTFLFENEEKIAFTYQPANPMYLTGQLEADWDGSAWIDTLKIRYTRNSMLNPTVEIESDIYGGTTVVDVTKVEYVYLAGDEQLSSEIRYSWNAGGSAWDNHSKYTYSYTTFNELDVVLLENYQSSAFIPWLRTTYTYDPMERETEELTELYSNSVYENYSRKITSYIPTSVGDESPVINGFTLEQNYPNPFNPATKIKYSIPKIINNQSSIINLKVYDVLGNEVATLVNEEKPAGVYEVNFDASKLSSGIYLYKLQAGSFVQTKKMMLLK
ncbi:MAG: T9SS type A sorting domain-containing protein [Ignavibacteria bacterium]|nr:T9SS type A sorting domain-containing protein [Ignavibacteria bacterium]